MTRAVPRCGRPCPASDEAENESQRFREFVFLLG
ncbi:hypothetical protein FHU43_1040 [Halopolyspora algeriensis]|nr:hypothetical protein FHU43_1040 [Halopolyspora algeriensis]